jgi:small-conductance mechanosensitive channel
MKRTAVLWMTGFVSLFPVAAFASRYRLQQQDSPSSSTSPESRELSKKAGEQESQAADSSSAEQKKAKKVWTNENLKEASADGVSQIGSDRAVPAIKKAPVKPASPQAAAIRKQISTLQAQLANLDKQIAELQSFQKGEKPGDVGLQLHKGYTTEPIADQIRKLEEKKKLVAAQIDTAVDEARKLGILPGQLR